MKKCIVLLMALCLCLAGCGQETPETTAAPETTTTAPETTVHTHALTQWEADPLNHWYVCECGEKAELGAHTPDETEMCTVCECIPYPNEDGSGSVCFYDEQGALCLMNDFDAEGNLISSQRNECTYDDKGNVTNSKSYLDGFLYSEENYQPCQDPENGDIYLAESISYNEDGTKQVTVFDEEFNALSYTEYDADGNVAEQSLWEYELDEEGGILKKQCITNGVLSQEEHYFVSDAGEYLDSKSVYYDENGEPEHEYTHEYAFGEDGSVMEHITYYNGALYSEDYYALDDEGWRYLSREVQYNEDGELEYDYSYDAEGNVIGEP